ACRQGNRSGSVRDSHRERRLQMAGGASKSMFPVPVAVGILCAAIGVGIGYWSRGYAEDHRVSASSGGGAAGGMGRGGSGGGGMMGGMGGGGGGQQHPNVG